MGKKLAVVGIIGLALTSLLNGPMLVSNAEEGVVVASTGSDIDAYIADKMAPGQKYFLYNIFNKAIAGNLMSVKREEVYPADVGDADMDTSITFKKDKLYILNAVSIRTGKEDYEATDVFFSSYGTTAGVISSKSYQYIHGGCDFDCYYDEDSYVNNLEQQIANNWKMNVSKLVNQCHSSPGDINWCSVGSNIIFIPSEDITLTLNLSQALKYPSSNCYILEANMAGWVAPGSDLQAPIVNVPATYVVNVDSMEILDNILTHVKVTDETDPNPKLIVRSSSYNASNRECGTFPVTIYAQDASGNVSEDLTFNVIVADATSPSISIKTGLTVANNPVEMMTDEQLIQFLFNISDNYDSFGDLRIELNRGAYNSSNYHVAGTKEVSVEVYDRAGNFSDAFATFTVLDATEPTITATNKEVANNDQLSEQELLALFTVSDDTSAVDKITKNIIENTYSSNWNKPGTYQVTCEAADEAGNTSRATSTITVFDAIPPQVSVTPITISYTHKLTNEEILAHITATDDQVTPTITLDRAAYDASYAKVGSYVINVNVTDGRNVVKKELHVAVIDDVKPIIVGPSVVEVGNSTKLTIEELKSKFTVTDAIDRAIDFKIEDLNGYADSYTIVNKYDFKIVATDAAGNNNTFISTLEVKDTTSPKIRYDQYFIVLQEGDDLTNEMIKSYASQVFNVSLESIVSIEGEYDVEKVGTYSLRIGLDDGTKKEFNISVTPNENKQNAEEKPASKFDWKHFFSGDISNWNVFNAWPAWSISVWLMWIGIGIGSLLVLCLLIKIIKTLRRIIKG